MRGMMMDRPALDLGIDRVCGALPTARPRWSRGRSKAACTATAYADLEGAQQAVGAGVAAAWGQAGRPRRDARVERLPSLRALFRVSGMGAVCHTVNPRLFHDQLRYIVNHAADSLLFVDLTS